MELPYTLPQDFTLFLLFGESSIEIWKRKLDWIAERGGMALLNVHPDYLWSARAREVQGTSLDLYHQFLEHVRTVFHNRLWNPLPKEAAGHCLRSIDSGMTQDHTAASGVASMAAEQRAIPPASRRKPLHVCLMGALFYETDNRTMRYAETLRRRGDDVDVICVRRPGQPKSYVLNGVNVFRVQLRRRDEKGRWSYAARLVRFLFSSGWRVTCQHLRRPYDLIHAHSIPDFEVFATLVPKLMGTKVILDIYDVTPEFYASKFGVSRDSLGYRFLLWVEKVSARFADHVISANHLWQTLLTSRSVPARKCTPFINYIDTNLFQRRPRTRNGGGPIIIYPGVLQWHQGIDIAVRAFRQVKTHCPTAQFHIYGEGPEREKICGLIRDLGITDSAFVKAPVPLAEIPQILANADLGVVAKRNDVFGNEAYSTKILEYMTQGIPAVVPRTAIDSYYFTDAVVQFFEPGNAEDMAEKMLRALTDGEHREVLVRNALAYVQANSWESKQQEYVGLVDELCEGK